MSTISVSLSIEMLSLRNGIFCLHFGLNLYFACLDFLIGKKNKEGLAARDKICRLGGGGEQRYHLGILWLTIP